MKKIKTSKFDKIFDEGKEDIVDYLDLTRTRKVNLEPKRVNVDFPMWMVQRLDREAEQLGVTRQSLIKLWVNDRLMEKRPDGSRR